VVLVRDLQAALARLNPNLPESAREQAIEKLTRVDFARSLIQHNREYYAFIRGGVPVDWRDASGEMRYANAKVIDFRNVGTNRFLAVRELKVQGLRVPHYNRRADLVCYVNGLPLVFIELKAVYRNIRAGFDDNLTDYLNEHSIAHAFHHNAFLVVSNGDQARYGSITSKWDHFVEWKRNGESDKARLDAEALLDGMLAKGHLLDLVENFVLFDDSRAGGTRKIVARNHQVLGVNRAVVSVIQQEDLKRRFPLAERLVEYRAPRPALLKAAEDRQAGLREPGREARHRAAGPERPDRRRHRARGTRFRPDRAAGEAARQGLRGHHGRRSARQAGRRFCGALLHPLGDRQIDAGMHRQNHLCADVPAHRTALAETARRDQIPDCR
jgi:type I restriction enzyme R subunit